MMEMNRDRDKRTGSNIEDLDLALDAALTRYAGVEPRAGLEDRILANLRAQRQLAQFPAWWRWGVVGALSAIVIVAMTLAWRAGRSAHLPMANHPTTTEQIRRAASPPAAAVSERPVGNTPTGASHSGGVIAVRRAAPRAQAVADADPKLDVFPSPRPLSEEELALARYVRSFPSDAKLVAQAQEASEREVLAKMQALANESTESN
jgi:hypothetical protein